MIDPTAPIVSLLDRWGPGSSGVSAAPASPADAWAYVRGLAGSHYENFSVLSSLVPPRLRDDFAAVYAFCRWSDDLGDETGRDEAARRRSLELLAWWRGELDGCYRSLGLPVTAAGVHRFSPPPPPSPPSAAQRDGAPGHPVFVALAQTIARHRLPHRLFADLIDAFAQDQSVREYATWEQLVGYCERSANPVGRLVLMLGGFRPSIPAPGDPPRAGADPHPGDGTGDDPVGRFAMSDATCTALQLINFWQDVRRDLLERDRVYIPAETTGITPVQLREWVDRPADPAARVRYIRAVRPLVERTAALFEAGSALPATLGPDLGPVVGLFGAGGRSVLRSVESIGCATLWQRPRLGRSTKLALVARAYVGAALGRWLPGRGAKGRPDLEAAGGTAAGTARPSAVGGETGGAAA